MAENITEESLLEFPCDFPIKVMGETSDAFASTMVEVIKAIAAEGIAILLVEQNVRQALSLTQRAYVMDTGTITLSGMASELLNNPEVIHAYLGG